MVYTQNSRLFNFDLSKEQFISHLNFNKYNKNNNTLYQYYLENLFAEKYNNFELLFMDFPFYLQTKIEFSKIYTLYKLGSHFNSVNIYTDKVMTQNYNFFFKFIYILMIFMYLIF
jgi:hypothetical protein